MHRIKWPDAEIALAFIRPVFGLSEEVQMRMIEKSVQQLGIRHEMYKSSISGGTKDERGKLLNLCSGTEVVVVARLNVLAKPGSEVKSSVSQDFMVFVSALRHKCKYILVLDDNLPETPRNSPVTSEDCDWDAVFSRAAQVVTNGRRLTSEEGRKRARVRWSGQFRGVYDEWTKNPERAKDLEDMGRIWRDPIYPNARAAYEAMPDDVRTQIKSLPMANRIFGKRKPDVKGIGRPKKST